MINICHITTAHPNRYDTRIFEKECTSLSDAGNKVTLIVNDNLPDEIKNGVKIVSLRHIPKNRLERATRITRMALKKALEVDAQVYHIHDPELLWVGVKLAGKNKKVIFDSHEFHAVDVLTKTYLPKWSRKPLYPLYRNYEEKCLNRLSGLIVPCTYEGKDYFENVNIPKEIIGNYPSIKVLESIANGLDEYQRKSDVCYIGDVTESRGAFHMVKAASLAGRKLVLIGEILPASLKEQLEKMPEFENVEYLGVLPHEAGLKEVIKSSVGLCLLQDEGQYAKIDNLPTKLYEYMYLGVPSIVSDFPYYKKVLGQYDFGIAVNPTDDVAIANAINKIMSDTELYQRMAKEGKRAIVEEMNWEKEADKLIKFYSKICS